MKTNKIKIDMTEKVKCKICNDKEGELDYAESTMDFIHGFKKKICKGCYKKILLDKRKSINKMLKSLTKRNQK